MTGENELNDVEKPALAPINTPHFDELFKTTSNKVTKKTVDSPVKQAEATSNGDFDIDEFFKELEKNQTTRPISTQRPPNHKSINRFIHQSKRPSYKKQLKVKNLQSKANSTIKDTTRRISPTKQPDNVFDSFGMKEPAPSKNFNDRTAVSESYQLNITAEKAQHSCRKEMPKEKDPETVTVNDSQYLQFIRDKAISLSAAELTRAEAEHLVCAGMTLLPGKKTLSKTLPYRCHICDAMNVGIRTFKYPYQLLQHYRCHLDDRPFQCPSCFKSFTRSKFLAIHKKDHLNDETLKVSKEN
ncbi:unnamed protein product [Oikopleura dioica]|uniref:C2H2-type domain-containing protein n=1 Tax=Oikopleura dioica TaxID=34765 RepID=E4YKQ6_OIKDI|nr:unnamed protein product [Oikopleura dioica]